MLFSLFLWHSLHGSFNLLLLPLTEHLITGDSLDGDPALVNLTLHPVLVPQPLLLQNNVHAAIQSLILCLHHSVRFIRLLTTLAAVGVATPLQTNYSGRTYLLSGFGPGGLGANTMLTPCFQPLLILPVVLYSIFPQSSNLLSSRRSQRVSKNINSRAKC